MKYTSILEKKEFDKSGLYKVSTASGKSIKDNETTIGKILSKQGEFIFTKYNGETITFGQDEEESGVYFVVGRSPKSFKEFKNFKSAFSHWKSNYRKVWDK